MPALDHHLPLLRTGRWFGGLPPAFADGLLHMARLRHLQAGESLFLRDAPPCGLYGLLRGGIRISGQTGGSHTTREAVLVLLSPPQWFGEISVFDGSARTHDAHAAEASTLLQVPHDDLLAWLERHPTHWRDLAVLMADKLRLAFVSMEEQTVLPAPQRLARRLLTMAQGYGQAADTDRTHRVLSVTQEQLALMIGISRQTTNQILRDFKTRGVLRLQRGSIELLDVAALRVECE
ncbi:Crp/Fnr family transcriptional regulator [Rhodoferax sp.]|uniref:Crp/Fnr family transcriptional regulator n=1 Tax=Rhodoferax sp. TaxID=50421 RepID=UPI0025E27E55|nr:Crp/Fnr family transcriptional regulator [Rhodoferax sp.]